MRKIKFRAWDYKNKEMIYRPFGMTSQPKTDDGKNILLQFTSLLDKNGKEIYEGDIVLTNDNNPRLVVWSRFAWFLENLPSDDGIDFISRDAVREFIDATGKSHEIIGNIYENKEKLST